MEAGLYLRPSQEQSPEIASSDLDFMREERIRGVRIGTTWLYGMSKEVRSGKKLERYSAELVDQWLSDLHKIINDFEKEGVMRLVLTPGKAPLLGRKLEPSAQRDNGEPSYKVGSQTSISSDAELEISYAEFHIPPVEDNQFLVNRVEAYDVAELLYVGDKYKGIVVPAMMLGDPESRREISFRTIDHELENLKKNLVRLPGSYGLEFARSSDGLEIGATQKFEKLPLNLLVDQSALNIDSLGLNSANAKAPQIVAINSGAAESILTLSYQSDEIKRLAPRRASGGGDNIAEKDKGPYQWVHLRPGSDGNYEAQCLIDIEVIKEWELIKGDSLPALGIDCIDSIDVIYREESTLFKQVARS